MILEVYSVFDDAAKAFLPPFHARSKGEALRNFSAAANDAGHQFNKFSKDYTLFNLGYFDDSSGMMQPFEVPSRVIGAYEVIDDPVSPAARIQ